MSIEYVGPFEQTYVVIDGRRVPFLEAEKDAQGVVRFLNLPSRSVQLPPFDPDRPYDAENIISFVADAIAIGMGYTCFPTEGREPFRTPDFVIMHEIGSIETGHDEDGSS